MPTIPIIPQPVLHASTAPSTFSVTTVVSEQHRRVALGIGERIWQQILGISFDRLLEYSDKFGKLFSVIELYGFDPSPLHTKVENLFTHISKYQELHNNFSGKLTGTALFTHLAAIQRQARKVELVKELEQLEVEIQQADTKIHKVNDEMSRDQHMMAHLAIEQTNLKNTPIISSKDSKDLEALCISREEIISSKDSKDLEALCISLEEERAEVAQLKWMD
ncbi:hypothetical protein ACH5RR_033973 [Cinchona calisaya]|uniref:Uncharacterized protein n=1 Tax=Cinchona calisaya TaxID=153742 RepID=A0ABD2Y9J2_9GENT